MKLINKTRYDSRQLKTFIGRAMKSELGRFPLKQYVVTVQYKRGNQSTVRAFKKRPAFTVALPDFASDIDRSQLVTSIKQATNYTVSGAWNAFVTQEELTALSRLPLQLRPEPKQRISKAAKAKAEMSDEERKLTVIDREIAAAAKSIATWTRKTNAAVKKLTFYQKRAKRLDKMRREFLVVARKPKPSAVLDGERSISFENV